MDGILDFIRSVPDSPQGLLDFVMSLLIAHGYLVVFVGAALDNFGLPASGDIVLFAGGFFANSGRAALPLARIIHEHLRKLSKERAMTVVPDARRPDADEPSSRTL